VQLLLELSHTLVDIGGQLDLALLAHHPARFARGGVGSLLGRLDRARPSPRPPCVA
jgi:hypothetical protein